MRQRTDTPGRKSSNCDMLHKFLTVNRADLIDRCRAKVAQRAAPKASTAELEHGIPLFLDQLIKTLQVEQTPSPMQSRKVSGPTGGDQRSMSEMGETAMPGGWTLSMAWMPMCGQTWMAAAASFIGMWTVMMVAMMLPSLAPLLWRHRPMAAVAAGAGYFFVWTALGAIIFALGAAFAEAAMRVPSLARVVANAHLAHLEKW